jgi:CPA2 family monovalent cation:H+ antiporter-2
MTGSAVLIELVIVLGTAALISIVFQALRLPVVLGYVLAGLVIGPHVPVPLVADPELVHVLSQLGVVLLMFTIGLELPIKTIARVGLPSAMIAVFEVALVIAIGTVVAGLFGFDAITAVLLGACLGISSTMLVAKTFAEHGWKGGFTEIVFAILVFEDVIAVVLLATETAVVSGSGLDAGAIVALVARLIGFLALILLGGMAIVPRAIRGVAARARRETLAISALLVCFATAAIAASAGYSVALGAFIAGVLVAESGHGRTVYSLVEVLRDVFAAVFFVSVGMSIEPGVLASEAGVIVACAAVVLAIKPLAVALGVFVAGQGVRPAVRAGLALAQIGELSFVIAGVTGNPRLLAIAVGVACATTLLSPALIGRAGSIADIIASGLPRRLATFVSFYESWLDRMRAKETSAWRRHRRSMLVLAFDAALLIAVLIVGSTLGQRLLAETDLTHREQTAVRFAAMAVLSTPIAISTARRIALIARRVALDVIPEGGNVDLGSAPRRALAVTIEIALALVLIVPIVAIIQPFVPGTFALLVVLGLVLVLVMRRSVVDFAGHVRAASELVLELLAQPQPQAPGALLPGFDGTETIDLAVGSPAVGRSLAELDLRAQTGATVLAIARGDHGIAAPLPTEPLQAGDRLALAGSAQAIREARTLLGCGHGCA